MIELPHLNTATKGGQRDMDKVLELFNNSGFTAVIASLGAVLITGIFSMQIDKKREQHQFIRQILPERIKAHSNIIEMLITIQEKLISLITKHPKDRINILIESYNKSNALFWRNTIWTDSEVSKYCNKIHSLLFSFTFNEDKTYLKKEITNIECISLLEKFSVYNETIKKRIAESLGVPLLDKILSKMEVISTKKTGNLLKNPKDKMSKNSSCKSKADEH
jgi:hypothetical protein